MATTPDEQHQRQVIGWAARDQSGILSPFNFFRRGTGERDVAIKVLYCGICHSDIHFCKNEWRTSAYPLVPGHEITGVVTQVGSKVKTIQPGHKVAIGGMVGSCRSCERCMADLECYCRNLIGTYNFKDVDGTITFGGFSDFIVVDHHFVVRIPESLPLDAAAPLLCAGITVYSPLRFYGLDKCGMHVGVVGLGGLGHMAVKFAKAMGLRVTVISRSPGKEEAIDLLGADAFIVSGDEQQMREGAETMDGIIDTVSAEHPLLPLLGLLKLEGKLVLVGAPEKPLQVPVMPLLTGRKTVCGSMIGGMKEIQEMVDFAAKHGVKAEVEVVPIDYVNNAMYRMEKGDVRYRFVIDIGNTLHSTN